MMTSSAVRDCRPHQCKTHEARLNFNLTGALVVVVVVVTPAQPGTKITNWRFQPNVVSLLALTPTLPPDKRIEINLLKGPYWAFGTTGLMIQRTSCNTLTSEAGGRLISWPADNKDAVHHRKSSARASADTQIKFGNLSLNTSDRLEKF